jgi:hypothetical protein
MEGMNFEGANMGTKSATGESKAEVFDRVNGLFGMNFVSEASKILGDAEYYQMVTEGVEDRAAFLAAIRRKLGLLTENETSLGGTYLEGAAVEFNSNLANPNFALAHNPDGDPGEIYHEAQMYETELKRDLGV